MVYKKIPWFALAKFKLGPWLVQRPILVKKLIMAMKNKCILRSKISEAKLRQIVRIFNVDLNATQITQVLSAITFKRLLRWIRERIAHICEDGSSLLARLLN